MAGMAVIAVPSDADAYPFVAPRVFDARTGEVCPAQRFGERQFNGYTARVVGCVKETLITAIRNFIVPFSNYLSYTIGAVIALGVLFWGASMVMGKVSAPAKDALVLGLKIGAIMLFTTQFVFVFGLMLDSMEYMLWAMTYFIPIGSVNQFCYVRSDPVYLVWQSIDCALESLVGGLLAPWTIMGGITGFLIAALFSQSVGIFVAVLGVLMIVQFIMAILRAMYIFIGAYIGVSILAAVSPIFIPLILFKATKAYFEKWLKLILGFMLQPVFLFVYLAMLLVAYQSIMYTGPMSVYRAVAGDIIDSPCYTLTPGGVLIWNGASPCFTTLGEWLLDPGTGAYAARSQADMAMNVSAKDSLAGDPNATQTGVAHIVGENPTVPAAWAGDIFDYLANAFYKVSVPTVAVDWDQIWIAAGAPSQEAYLTNLIFVLILAAVMTHIFMVLLNYLPYISSGISGDVLSMPALGVGQFAPAGDKMINSFRDGIAGKLKRR